MPTPAATSSAARANTVAGSRAGRRARESHARPAVPRRGSQRGSKRGCPLGESAASVEGRQAKARRVPPSPRRAGHLPCRHPVRERRIPDEVGGRERPVVREPAALPGNGRPGKCRYEVVPGRRRGIPIHHCLSRFTGVVAIELQIAHPVYAEARARDRVMRRSRQIP